MKKIVLTGAGGSIGTVLRAHFADTGRPLTITDIRELSGVRSSETAVVGDLSDAAFTRALLQDADAVIHMAGVSTNKSFEEILPHNIVALNNLYVAAREQGVRRVIFASSNHATGMYTTNTTLTPQVVFNPDSYYGLSKVFGEALARMFWEKHEVESVCLRIGSFLQKPTSPRHLSTWLSFPDLCALVDASLVDEQLGFEIVYGVSANIRKYWDNSSSRVAYTPTDNAETFLADIERGGIKLTDIEARYQGGDYVADDFGR